jgi:outer membrane protein OmpA-like peptidoglycan-associated protein
LNRICIYKHRRKSAMEAFEKVVDYEFKGDRLAVKFLFKPGSTQFISDRSAWLEKIAERTAATKGCLKVVGHTSATSLPAINDRLSGLRADHI